MILSLTSCHSHLSLASATHICILPQDQVPIWLDDASLATSVEKTVDKLYPVKIFTYNIDWSFCFLGAASHPGKYAVHSCCRLSPSLLPGLCIGMC